VEARREGAEAVGMAPQPILAADRTEAEDRRVQGPPGAAPSGERLASAPPAQVRATPPAPASSANADRPPAVDAGRDVPPVPALAASRARGAESPSRPATAATPSWPEAPVAEARLVLAASPAASSPPASAAAPSRPDTPDRVRSDAPDTRPDPAPRSADAARETDDARTARVVEQVGEARAPGEEAEREGDGAATSATEAPVAQANDRPPTSTVVTRTAFRAGAQAGGEGRIGADGGATRNPPGEVARAAARGTALGAYLGAVEAIIAERWAAVEVPLVDRVLGREAEVVLAFEVRGSGRVFGLRITVPSGLGQLDADALASVPAQLPPIPREVGVRAYDHRLILRYQSVPIRVTAPADVERR
jgi:hypothetical protein